MTWSGHDNALWDNPYAHIARESNRAVRRRLEQIVKTNWLPISAARHSTKKELTGPLRKFYDYVNNAHKMWLERQENSNAFSALRSDLRYQIKEAHNAVRMQRQIERDSIENNYL